MGKKTIIIAATHRSGSYHFCDLLSQYAGIPLPEEHLNFDLLYARDQLGLGRDIPIDQVLQKLMEHLAVNDVFTIKAMWAAYVSVFRKIATEKGLPLETWTVLPPQVFPNPRYVFIRRKDKIGQAVSFYKAFLTGIWRFERETPPYAAALLAYDFRQIRERLEELETMEAAWEEYLHGQQTPYLEIWHEDFLADRLGVLKQTCEFLGLEPVLTALPETRFVRAPNDVNADWIKRYRRHAELAATTAAEVGDRPTAGMSADVAYLRANPAAPRAGTMAALSFRLTNTGSQAWPEVGSGPDTGWLELQVTLAAAGAVKQRARLGIHENLAPGSATEISVPLELPPAGGAYDGIAELVQLGAGALGPATAFRLAIDENPTLSELNRLLPGWSPTDVPDWKEIPSLGRIKVDGYPWIYHPEHGWQYIHQASSKPGQLILHDEQLGWLYFRLEDYPESIQCLDTHTWVRYEGARDQWRTFRVKQTGETIRVPKNLGKKTP